MLKTENLSKTYPDGMKALTNLGIEVRQGEIYCLLGANGAGKTTTINLFLNYITPTGGKAFINGIDVVQNPLESKKYISYVPENVLLYSNLKAIHNVEFFAQISGRTGLGKGDYDAALKRVGLDESAFDKKVKHLSKGMRQKVALATAIVKNAPNMLLDEPTSGLDPKAAYEFTLILVQLKNEDKAILISTHDLFRARQIADRIGIMKKGVLVAEMTSAEIGDKNIEDIYLNYMENSEAAS